MWFRSTSSSCAAPAVGLTWMGVLGWLVPAGHSAELRLQNAADGSSVIHLGPDERGIVSIVLITDEGDTLNIGSLGANIYSSDPNVWVDEVFHHQSDPWMYDLSLCYLWFEVCTFNLGDPSQYSLFLYDPNPMGGYPPQAAEYLLDSVMFMPAIGPGSKSEFYLTFDPAPVTFAVGPGPEFIPWITSPDCFPPGWPNVIYFDVGAPGPICITPVTVYRTAERNDCNLNFVADPFDLWLGTSVDCQGNGTPDECEPDCNHNEIPDECDLLEGTSEDCDANAVPDECQPDCNGNIHADSCDINEGNSLDCNVNGVPDECEDDCNHNSLPDGCDISSGASRDINGNQLPDECEGCVGDVNEDGAVDPLDMGFLASRFGCPVGAGDAGCDAADVNIDGLVDPLDVGYVLSRFGECP